MNYLPDVVTFSVSIQLPKVVHQRSHARRQVKHTVHQLAKWNLAC